MEKYAELINDLGSIEAVIDFERQCIIDIDAEIEVIENQQQPEWQTECGIPAMTEEEREANLRGLNAKREKFVAALEELTKMA